MTKAEINKLIEDHVPYATKLAKTMAKKMPPHIHLADLVSAANVGLVAAAHNFDPSRGTKFTSYSYLRIIGAMIDDLRAESAPRRMQTLSELDEVPDPVDEGADPSEIAEAGDLAEYAMSFLPARVRDMTYMRFGLGHTLREIAQTYKISEERVRVITKVGIERMREVRL